MTGYTPEEIVGAQFQPLIHADDVPACVAYLAGIFAARLPGPLVEYRVRHADGTWHWHKAAVNPVLGPGREVISVIGVSRDITDLKLAEVALRESEERYRTFFNSAETMKITFCTADGAIEDANPAALDFYGYDLERLRGLCIYDLNSSPQGKVQIGFGKVANLENGHFFFQHRLTSGEFRDVEIYTSNINHLGKRLVMASIRDITEMRRLEQVKEDVEHILRHDLRAPLTGLINLPLMLMEDESLSPDQRKILHLVAISGRKMLNQINSSLELHKIEEGTFTLKPQECSPVQLVRNNINIFTAIKGIDQGLFVIHEHANGAEKSGLTLQTDGLLLDIVLMNLLRNAMEASDPDKHVFVDISEDGEEFSIAISNSRSVPLEVRDRFFEKYATARKVGGTGLGTYSAFIMTRAIGGTIVMETSEEFGTKVTVRIPIRASETG